MGEKYPKANKNNRDRKNSSDTLIYQTKPPRVAFIEIIL